MNLIEQLGGYEMAKEQLNELQDAPKDAYSWSRLIQVENIKQATLEHRRTNNIFEVGDKVVSINSAFIEYQGVLNIDFIDKFNIMLSDDSKGFDVNAICGWSKIIRHANDEEIKAGKRLSTT